MRSTESSQQRTKPKDQAKEEELGDGSRMRMMDQVMTAVMQMYVWLAKIDPDNAADGSNRDHAFWTVRLLPTKRSFPSFHLNSTLVWTS